MRTSTRWHCMKADITTTQSMSWKTISGVIHTITIRSPDWLLGGTRRATVQKRSPTCNASINYKRKPCGKARASVEFAARHGERTRRLGHHIGMFQDSGNGYGAGLQIVLHLGGEAGEPEPGRARSDRRSKTRREPSRLQASDWRAPEANGPKIRLPLILKPPVGYAKIPSNGVTTSRLLQET